jgi:hypothetical protein
MTQRGTQQKTIVYKVLGKNPKYFPRWHQGQALAARNQLQAADTRTEAQSWLGDPPPDRSALAQRDRR